MIKIISLESLLAIPIGERIKIVEELLVWQTDKKYYLAF